MPYVISKGVTWQKPPRGAVLDVTHPLARGLVGCWLLNEGTGNKAWDFSLNQNSGTICGCYWTADGLRFEEKGYYVDCGNSEVFQFPEEFAYVVLFKWDGNYADSNYKTLIGHRKVAGSVVTLLSVYGPDSRLRCDIYNDGRTNNLSMNGPTIQANEITLAVLNVKADTTTELWGGLEKSTGNVDGPFTDFDKPLCIGRHTYSSSQDFSGWIFEALVYNRALTEDEICWLYQEPYAMFLTPITRTIVWMAPSESSAWWTFGLPVQADSERYWSWGLPYPYQAQAEGSITKISSDTEVISESVLRYGGMSRLVAEVEAIVEDVVRVAGMNKIASEVVSLIDSVVRSLKSSRVVNEVVSLIESTVRSLKSHRIANETVRLVESTLKVFRIYKVAQSMISLSENIVRKMGAVRVAVSETVSIAEDLIRKLSSIRVASEVQGIVESTLRSLKSMRVVVEQIKVVEGTLKRLVSTRIASEAISILDYVIKLKWFSRIASETLAIQEGVLRLGGMVKVGLTETLGIIESTLKKLAEGISKDIAFLSRMFKLRKLKLYSPDLSIQRDDEPIYFAGSFVWCFRIGTGTWQLKLEHDDGSYTTLTNSDVASGTVVEVGFKEAYFTNSSQSTTGPVIVFGRYKDES